jgi:hypothetical protein
MPASLLVISLFNATTDHSYHPLVVNFFATDILTPRDTSVMNAGYIIIIG